MRRALRIENARLERENYLLKMELDLRSLGIRSTIKYVRHGCTRRASDPQYLAENVLVHETLDRALAANPDAHPLFHSDRGFQYTTRVFHDKLAAAGMTQSMSQVGKCIDNGPMEGFWVFSSGSGIMAENSPAGSSCAR